VAEQETCAVWAENWPAVQLFEAMGTQWRVGFAGPVGLDYAAIPFVLRMQSVPRADWPAVFADLGVMESEALKLMGEKNEAARRNRST
jgi:hypothetical protein